MAFVLFLKTSYDDIHSRRYTITYTSSVLGFIVSCIFDFIVFFGVKNSVIILLSVVSYPILSGIFNRRKFEVFCYCNMSLAKLKLVGLHPKNKEFE